MSNTWEGFYANGYDKGYGSGYDDGDSKATARAVMNLMKNCSIDLETAMKYISVSEEMKPQVLEYIRLHTTN